MQREPVNPDDPQMTAYALGELSASEAAEFESRLLLSPNARRELDDLRVVMDLLGEGLKREWKSGCEVPSLTLLAPAADSVIVRGEFRPSRRRYSLAGAAAAAALVAMGVYSFRPVQPEAAALASAPNWGAPNPAEAAGGEGTVHVPRLMLAEEVSDLASLDFVSAEDAAAAEAVDASYLDANQVVPASFHPGSVAERGLQGIERVDSYLPPIHGDLGNRGFKSGMIERLGGPGGGSSSFRTVSITGSPVVNEESDLRLLADLNGLQRDLSEAIAGMPENSHDRAKLTRVLERSQRLVDQLKREISN